MKIRRFRRKKIEDVEIYAPKWVIEEVCNMDLRDIFNRITRRPREPDIYPRKDFGDIRCLTANMNKSEQSTTR